jgi:hypothetical protein
MPTLALSRSSFPYLSRAAGTALQWNNGPLYNALLSSVLLRVSDRGISWCTTCDMPTDVFEVSGRERAQVPCLPTNDALCAVPNGPGNATLRLFPSTRVIVSAESRAAPDVATALGRLWSAVAGGCQGVESRRALVFGHHQYDVSLCDLVHDQFEFVLYPQHGILEWRKRDGSFFFDSMLWTALLTVAVLFLFTRVCENLSRIIRRRPRAFDWHATAVTLVGAVCSVPAAAHNDFATEERMLAFVLQVYSILCTALLVCGQAPILLHKGLIDPSASASAEYHLLRDSGTETGQQSVNTTGALIAVLILLTAHLSNTFDTPFLHIFVFVFGARSFLKFLNFSLLHSSTARNQPGSACAKFAGFLVDTLVFVCVLELGVRSSAHSESEYAGAAAGLLLIGALAGVFLFCVVERNTCCNNEI